MSSQGQSCWTSSAGEAPPPNLGRTVSKCGRGGGEGDLASLLRREGRPSLYLGASLEQEVTGAWIVGELGRVCSMTVPGPRLKARQLEGPQPISAP